MDNQQVTELAYHAGLFDGEGSLMITRHYNAEVDRKMYRSQIQFTNTDAALVNSYVSFLRGREIPYHVHVDNRVEKYGTRVCYQVNVGTLEGQRKWLNLFIPSLIGKKAQAELLLDYVSRRLRKNAEKSQAVDPRTGRFMSCGRAAFDDYDHELYSKLRTFHSGTSETLRVPLDSPSEDKVRPQ